MYMVHRQTGSTGVCGDHGASVFSLRISSFADFPRLANLLASKSKGGHCSATGKAK